MKHISWEGDYRLLGVVWGLGMRGRRKEAFLYVEGGMSINYDFISTFCNN